LRSSLVARACTTTGVEVLDTHTTRLVDARGNVDAAGERTVGEFPRESSGGREPTVDAYLRGAVGSDVATPQVVFIGAVDVRLERSLIDATNAV
jgi:hypothetical protein